MGIFTRFRDIVSSNINSMLDRAEDPEKLIRLMIREMEDTLVELKAACAAVMAETKTVQRRREDVGDRSGSGPTRRNWRSTREGTTWPARPWSKSGATTSAPNRWTPS